MLLIPNFQIVLITCSLKVFWEGASKMLYVFMLIDFIDDRTSSCWLAGRQAGRLGLPGCLAAWLAGLPIRFAPQLTNKEIRAMEHQQ